MDADQPLECDVNLEDDLGVTEITRAPKNKLPGEYHSSHLRMKILRYPAAEAEERKIGDTNYVRTFDDHIFLYHWPEEELLLELQDALASASTGLLLRETVNCTFASEATVEFYSPFFSADGKGRLRQKIPILHVLRRVFLASDHVPAGIQADPLPGRSRDVPGRIVVVDRDDDQPTMWTQNEYPWVDLVAARTWSQGDAVFAVERANCEADGNFVLGSVGVVSEAGKGAIVRQEMIASNNYYGASGDPVDEDVVAASVDSKAYWCIPKREFCYQQVPFGDFGVKAKKGDVAQFSPERIYTMERGLLAALQAAVVGACPKRNMKIRKY